jgi:hypothetical protein
MMESEKMATGYAMDAYIGMKTTTWGAAENSAAYGIDMNGITALTTGDWRMHNGALFNNSSSALLDITEAVVQITGQIKITGGSPGANKVLTSDANGLATWEVKADSAWNIITLGNDTENVSGQIDWIASDNDQGDTDINTSDQFVFSNFSGGVDVDGDFTAGTMPM